MQISSASSALLSTALGAQTAKDAAGPSLRPAADPGAQGQATVPPETAAGNEVTLSPTSAQAADPAALPVYAEIWKGGVKLAQVDVRGHVTSFSGPLGLGAGGGGGPVLAAQRAIQLAQQTGGEIRLAGHPLDSQTLMTRARLASVYGY